MADYFEQSPKTTTTLPEAIEVTGHVYTPPQNVMSDEDSEEAAFKQEAVDKSYRLKTQAVGKWDMAQSAIKEVVPFARNIADGVMPFQSFDADPSYNLADKDNQEIYQQHPFQMWKELDKAESTEQLLHISGQMHSAKADIDIVGDNTNFAGAMGLYAAASIVDPTSWFMYGLAAKAAKIGTISKYMDGMSSASKALGTGTVGAVVEGTSEYLIQSEGAREYENVAYASGFGFVIGGGGKFALDSLNQNHSIKKKEAFDKLTQETEVTAHTTMPRTQEETRNLIDLALSEDNLAPYRSKFTKAMGNWMPERLQNSPTYIAWKRGGAISALAHKFDTMPMNSTATKTEQALGTADGSIYTPELNGGKTAMDIKYELAETQMHLDRARMDTYQMYRKEFVGSQAEGKPLSQEEFSAEMWIANQAQASKYAGKKSQIKEEILKDKEFVDEIYTSLDSKLEKDAEYKKLDTDEAKITYRERYAEYEIDVAAREKMKDMPEYKLSDDLPDYTKKFMEATNTYYKSMNDGMVRSGMPVSQYFDPHFYQPRIYNTEAIKTDIAGAEKAFARAIVTSPEYARKYQLAVDKLAEVVESKGALSKDARVQLDELNTLTKADEMLAINSEKIIKLLEDPSVPPSIKSAILTRRMGMTDNIEELGINYKDVDDIETMRTELDTWDKMPSEPNPEVRAEIDRIVGESNTIQELMKLTGVSLNNIMEHKGFMQGMSSPSKRIAVSNLNEEVIAHELIHQITGEGLASNPKFKKDSDKLLSYLQKHRKEIIERVEAQEGGASSTHIRQRIKNMLLNSKEMYSTAMTDPAIAKVLNKITVGKTNKVSILTKLKNLLRDYLGIKKVSSKSALGHMFKFIDENAKVSKIQADEMRMRKKYGELEDEFARLRAEGEHTFDIQKKLLAQQDKVISYNQKVIDDVKAKQLAKKKELGIRIKDKSVGIDSDVLAARKEVQRIKSLPTNQAKATVKKLGDMTTMQELGFDSTPAALKGRTLDVNTALPELQKYMRTNEAQITQAYHYSTTGRIATQHATGFTDAKEYRRYLEDNGQFSKKDMQVAMDLFELTMGTRQIASDPSSGWEKGVRNIMSFNYITMGGQFAKYGMSEIGAGIYATNLSYMKELVPAMKAVKKMYQGIPLDKMEMDLISMTESGEIWSNSSKAKYGDYDFVESTFAGGLEKGLNKASQGMFRWTGLEGISTITKIALPRAFMRRILNESIDGKAAYDLVRWGIGPSDMKKIREQPITMNENGLITDFNFKAWDKDVKEKFQLATSRMSRDAILRPDATRIPAWMNDGGANPLIKLSKQFMSFAAMANERLLLRGFTERQSYAMVGALISGSILGMIELGSEELAISTGIMSEDNRRYDLSTEKGIANLARIVTFRNSFAGTGQFYMEAISDFNKFNGGERMMGKVGSATTGKVLLGAKAANEFIYGGKTGTAAQTHFVKGNTPFNNVFVVDSITKNFAKDWAAEARTRNFNRDVGYTGLKDTPVGEFLEEAK